MAKKLTDLEKAQDIIDKGRVQKIITEGKTNYYFVTGKTSNYLVILPNFCTCDQFIFRSIKQRGNVCYHIIAAKNCTDAKEIADINLYRFFEFKEI